MFEFVILILMEEKLCNECGGKLFDGKVCRDYFEDMITWDFEDFLGAGTVHHLTVLCYNLQHPKSYSKKGLEDAKEFLAEFVLKKSSFEEHDKRNRERLSSAVRDWKIVGTSSDHGKYNNSLEWSIHASDIAIQGKEGYEERVQHWAESVYKDLKDTGNL